MMNVWIGLFILNTIPAQVFSQNKPIPKLKVHETQRFLCTENGDPFFYLGDTAWDLFHRLDREEADQYLTDRKEKGFNVIQAVILYHHGLFDDPNAYGHLPLEGKDPAYPAVKDGPQNDYWDHVDFIIDLAAEKGLYIGLLPTWGYHVTRKWDQNEANVKTVQGDLS